MMRFFLAKSQKTLKVGKIRKYDEERVFFRKKSFHLFKSLFFTKMKGAKYALIAGRLVEFSNELGGQNPVKSVLTPRPGSLRTFC